jgi:hypothetical protein
VLDPYGYGDAYGGTPAKMREINLIRSRVERVVNEDLIRPFDFSVNAVGGVATSVLDEMKMKERLKLAWEFVKQYAGITGEEEEPPKFKSFEELDHYMERYKDVREQWGNDILKNALEQENLVSLFKDGFNHGIISTEEIYYVGIRSGKPDVRVVNPLNFEWEKSPENSKIEDADWAREERDMTMSEIIDEFSEYLSENDVRRLDEGDISNSGFFDGGLPGYAYDEVSLSNQLGNSRYGEDNAGYIRVVIVTWKSLERIGFYTFLDENGEPQTTMVDETFSLTPEMKANGDVLEWQWINSVWQGTKIGSDIYVNINPIKNQMRTQLNPAECKLPYVGGVYNNINADAMSFVDLCKPYQYLYVIVWYRIENELAKAKGKKMVMDLAQIPKSQGIDFKKWLYYFDTMGISFINSHEEGEDLQTAQSGVAKFNQFQALDMTVSNSIGQYLPILDKIESLMDKACGLNPQQLGDTMQRETAKGVQTALVNSSYIIESYFHVHNDIKKRVLNQYLMVAKYAYQNGATIHSITSDFRRMTIDIDGEKFNDSDYNVFVTNSSQEKFIKDEIKGLASIALQQDKANLSDMIRIIKSTSTTEIEKAIIKGEESKIQRDQQRFEQEQENIQQMEQQRIEFEQSKIDNDNMNKQLDRENELRKAMITATGFNEDKDMDNDGVPDIVEMTKLQLSQSNQVMANMNKSKELSHKQSENEKDRQLKREEIKSKEKIEDLKAKTALKNKVSGEK